MVRRRGGTRWIHAAARHEGRALGKSAHGSHWGSALTTPALRAGSSASGVGRRVASPRGFEAEPEEQIEQNTAQSRSPDASEPIEVDRPSVRIDQPVDESETNAEPLTDLGNVVETALAEALQLAAQAGQWEVVAKLAAELEARRVGRAGTVPGVVVPFTHSKSK